MKRELAIALITTLTGLTLGYFLKAYQDRPEPSLIMESIEFTRIERQRLPDIKIDDQLAALSRSSTWMDNLDSTISFSDLQELTENDLNDTVRELELMSLLLPKLRDLIEQTIDKEDFGSVFKQFLANESTPSTVTYLVMNIAGALRRREFVPVGLAKAYPKEYSKLLPAGERDARSGLLRFGDKDDEEDDENISARLALALIMEPDPEDLGAAVSLLQQKVPTQLVINQRILRQLEQKLASARALRYDEFVKVSALVVNSGNETVSVDQYATLSLPQIGQRFFMVADAKAGLTAIPPGEVRNFFFRSEQPLTVDEAKKLKSLYDTRIIGCQLTMRVVTQQTFTPGWLYSEVTEFSGDQTRIKELFFAHVPQRQKKVE